MYQDRLVPRERASHSLKKKRKREWEKGNGMVGLGAEEGGTNFRMVRAVPSVWKYKKKMRFKSGNPGIPSSPQASNGP